MHAWDIMFLFVVQVWRHWNLIAAHQHCYLWLDFCWLKWPLGHKSCIYQVPSFIFLRDKASTQTKVVHSTEAAVLCFMDEMHAITSYLPFSGSNELGLKTALWVLSVLPKNTQLTLEPRLLHDSANVTILQKKLLNTIILQYWIKIQCHTKTTTQYAGLEIKKTVRSPFGD